jgi:MarR family transcriptional regulator for hemolysin
MSEALDDSSLASAISFTARTMQGFFEDRLKHHGLTAPRGKVLLFLSMHPEGAMQSTVTDYLRVENPTAVRIIDGLEVLGLVLRKPSPTDRRAKFLVLTETGQAVADEVRKIVIAIGPRLMAGITSEEEATASKVLSRMRSNLAEWEKAPRWAKQNQELTL